MGQLPVPYPPILGDVKMTPGQQRIFDRATKQPQPVKNTWSIEKHHKFVAKIMFLAWPAQAREANKVWDDSVDRIKVPEDMKDKEQEFLNHLRGKLYFEAATSIVNKVFRYDDLCYFRWKHVVVGTRTSGERRVLCRSIEAEVSQGTVGHNPRV